MALDEREFHAELVKTAEYIANDIKGDWPNANVEYDLSMIWLPASKKWLGRIKMGDGMVWNLMEKDGFDTCDEGDSKLWSV